MAVRVRNELRCCLRFAVVTELLVTQEQVHLEVYGGLYLDAEDGAFPATCREEGGLGLWEDRPWATRVVNVGNQGYREAGRDHSPATGPRLRREVDDKVLSRCHLFIVGRHAHIDVSHCRDLFHQLLCACIARGAIRVELTTADGRRKYRTLALDLVDEIGYRPVTASVFSRTSLLHPARFTAFRDVTDLRELEGNGGALRCGLRARAALFQSQCSADVR
jgi:hypothetical protein